MKQDSAAVIFYCILGALGQKWKSLVRKGFLLVVGISCGYDLLPERM